MEDDPTRQHDGQCHRCWLIELVVDTGLLNFKVGRIITRQGCIIFVFSWNKA